MNKNPNAPRRSGGVPKRGSKEMHVYLTQEQWTKLCDLASLLPWGRNGGKSQVLRNLIEEAWLDLPISKVSQGLLNAKHQES